MLSEDKRLKEKRDFKRIYRKGRSSASDLLVIYAKNNNLNKTRFGFSVSKKIGKAVVRNKTKRILREICRLNFNKFIEGQDIIIIARKKIRGNSYKKIEKDLLKLADKVKILKREENENSFNEID